MRASCFAVALALAAFASPAIGQTMEFGCPDAGTTISFDSGTRIVSRGQDGMDCKMESADGKSFRVRGLLISSASPDGGDNSAFIAALRPERLWPLKVGNKIEAVDGWYKIDGWKLMVQAAAAPVLRKVAGKTELLVPISFKDGKAQMTLEYVW